MLLSNISSDLINGSRGVVKSFMELDDDTKEQLVKASRSDTRCQSDMHTGEGHTGIVSKISLKFR